MEKIKSWIYQGKGKTSEMDGSEYTGVDKRVESQQKSEKDDVIAVTLETKVDPKVADYFNEFPEPYKTKAIERFSSREGLYKWDFFRDLAMKREFEFAMRGKFMEDKREFSRNLIEREQEMIQKIEQERKDELKLKNDSELPAWEKFVRQWIPVHEDEQMGLKLFQATNMMALGVTMLWAGATLKRRKPHIRTWQYYMTLTGSVFFCGYLQVAAAYRLMDWGPFDRSVDNRDFVTKQSEEIKEYFSSLIDKLMERKNRP